MVKKNILLILALFLIVVGCADVKDALSGKKSENSDLNDNGLNKTTLIIFLLP